MSSAFLPLLDCPIRISTCSSSLMRNAAMYLCTPPATQSRATHGASGRQGAWRGVHGRDTSHPQLIRLTGHCQLVLVRSTSEQALQRPLHMGCTGNC